MPRGFEDARRSTMFSLLLFSLAYLLTFTHALPEVKLGKTTISGRAISDKVDFFGGKEHCLFA